MDREPADVPASHAVEAGSVICARDMAVVQPLTPTQIERIAEDQRRVNLEAIARGAAENPMRAPARTHERPNSRTDIIQPPNPGPQSPQASAPRLAITRCMRDIRPEPISWLWPGRIARGKVTLIAGDPGLGKTQLTAGIAACVSIGGHWPVDRSVAPRGNVLCLNAEDDAADTIRPRLDAAEADVSRIHILDAVRVLDNDGRVAQRGFNLARDIEALGEAVRRIGEVALVVIDPISAYLGSTDSHRNADVRGLLAPLSALAADIGAAVLLVSHLNKSAGTDAMMRVTGSLAFVAAARAAYVVVRDAEDRDPTRRSPVSTRSNM